MAEKYYGRHSKYQFPEYRPGPFQSPEQTAEQYRALANAHRTYARGYREAAQKRAAEHSPNDRLVKAWLRQAKKDDEIAQRADTEAMMLSAQENPMYPWTTTEIALVAVGSAAVIGGLAYLIFRPKTAAAASLVTPASVTAPPVSNIPQAPPPAAGPTTYSLTTADSMRMFDMKMGDQINIALPFVPGQGIYWKPALSNNTGAPAVDLMGSQYTANNTGIVFTFSAQRTGQSVIIITLTDSTGISTSPLTQVQYSINVL